MVWSFFLETNLGLYEKMKDYLHSYVFDRRGADVPEGENRWKSLIKLKKTDGLSESGFSACLLDYKSEKNDIKSLKTELNKMEKKLDEVAKSPEAPSPQPRQELFGHVMSKTTSTYLLNPKTLNPKP